MRASVRHYFPRNDRKTFALTTIALYPYAVRMLYSEHTRLGKEDSDVPDWSYQTLFRPLLFRMPARAARRLTLSAFGAVGRMPGGAFVIKTMGHQEPSPLLETGWSATPVGLAGTVDPNGIARRGLARLGFGFVEVGPVTVERIASDAPLSLNVQEERIVFPDPLENDGLAEIARRVADPGHRLPQHARLAPMPGSSAEEAELQLTKLAETLADAGAAGLYIETEPAQPPADRIRVLNGVSSWMRKQAPERRKPLYLALTPDATEEEARALLRGIRADDWSGVVIGGGAVAGADRLDGVLRLLRLARANGPAEWTLIAADGVHQPADALACLDAGAQTVLLNSGFVFAGPGLPKRINDAIVHRRAASLPEPETPGFFRNWGWMALLGLAMIVGGIAAWTIATTSVLLDYDKTFLGVTSGNIREYNAHLLHFMSHDRITLAGTMASLGILYYQLAKHGMREGMHWAKTAVVASCTVGFPSFFLYLGYGFFDPLHAAVAVLLLPFFLLSLRRHPPGLVDRSPASLANDRLWRRAMWGQLCFVALGFALAAGGLAIATIGVTEVFVPSDLAYLGLTADELDAFNGKLIPLIAHDRAGFGGALFADAVALTAIALWGIQIGRRWLWRTLLFGGAPAFFTGIGVHFDIGYVDFVHLLPAWFAFALYVAGLILLYPYMHATPAQSQSRVIFG